MCEAIRPPIDLPPMKRGSALELGVRGVEGLAPSGLEHRRPVGHLPARGDVGEVEGGGADVPERHPAPQNAP